MTGEMPSNHPAMRHTALFSLNFINFDTNPVTYPAQYSERTAKSVSSHLATDIMKHLQADIPAAMPAFAASSTVRPVFPALPSR
jgi:hypothetical protein